MKHTSKILIALLVLATMLMSMAVLTVGAETTTKVFDATEYLATDPDLTNIGVETAAGTEYPAGDMTIISGKSMKFDTSGNYDDGKTFSKGLKPGGKSSVSGNTVVRSIMFEVSGPATVKIWWKCGGDPKNNVPRYIAIWNASGTEVASAHKEDATKDSCYISELSVEEAGKYYIVCPIEQNVIHRVEVTENATSGGDTTECEHSWTDATCTAPKTCSLCNATEGEALGHTEATPATCTAKATCSVCEQEYGDVLPHDWDDGVASTEATCTVQGEMKYTCKNECGTATTAVLPYAHELDETGLCTKCNHYPFDPSTLPADGGFTAYNAFFSISGSISKKTNNGTVYAVELAKNSGGTIVINIKHNQSVVRVGFASTSGNNVSDFDILNSEGVSVIPENIDKTVKGTTAVFVEVILAAGEYKIVNPGTARGTRVTYATVSEPGHSHSEDESKRVEPTCIAVGSKTLVCACGDTKVEELAMLSEHPFATEWSKDAENHWYKCTTEGCTEISSQAAHNLVENADGNNVCSVCGYDAGHTCDYSVPDNDATHHWNKCSKCENIADKAEHVWDKAAVTCTEGRACDCGKKEAALGHTYVYGICAVCFTLDETYKYEFNFKASDVTAGTDKEALVPYTVLNNFLMVFGDVKQRTKNEAVYALEVGKNGTGALIFTVNGTATVTIEFASTGGSNTSAVCLLNDRGNMVLADDFTWQVTGTAPTALTYTLKSGTYYIVSPVSIPDYDRGARVISVDVDAYGCNHTYVEGYVQPTCLLTGGKAQVCSKCNHTVIADADVEAALGHSFEGSICKVCLAANPDYITNEIKVGDNSFVCNEHHLVGDLGPYEFITIEITEAGLYDFAGTGLAFTIFTTPIGSEGADFTAGTGASWATYVFGSAQLEAGTYYVGINYLAGVGEYTATVKLHEHKFEEGKCACGESDPNYVPPHTHTFVEGKCECGESDPNFKPAEPAPKLNFFQKIWLAIVNFFKNLFAGFKK